MRLQERPRKAISGTLTLSISLADLGKLPCPICSATGHLSPTNVEIGPGEIYDCACCQGKALLPPGEIEYTNSGWTELRVKRWQDDIDRAKAYAPRILKHAGRMLARPVSHVLEVGCGSGFMGVGFSAAGVGYTGTEIDEASIDWAASQGIDTHCVAAENLDVWADGKSFDLVISSNVYEHVASPHEAFRALGNLNAGLIAVIVPNAMGLIANLKSYRAVRHLATAITPNRATAWSIDGRWHNIGYSAQTLRFMAARSGLTVEHLETTAINDPIWGYVQPNKSLRYRLAESIESLAGRRTALLMLARPKV